MLAFIDFAHIRNALGNLGVVLLAGGIIDMLLPEPTLAKSVAAGMIVSGGATIFVTAIGRPS